MRRRIGDPSKADPAKTVGQVIIEAIRGGAEHVTAAHYAGVADSTVRGWLRRGLDEITRASTVDAANSPGEDEPLEPYLPTEAPYAELAEEILHAEAAMELRVVAQWQQAMRSGKVLTVRTYQRTDSGVEEVDARDELVPDWRAVERFAARRIGRTWADQPAPGTPLQHDRPVIPTLEQAQAAAAQALAQHHAHQQN